MGLTLTWEEAKGRTALDLIQEAISGHEPLIVSLEDGTTVSIQEYQPSEQTGEALTLEPLPQFSVSIPEGWQDAIYDHA